jgi:Domain of unknown function (DUF3480)
VKNTFLYSREVVPGKLSVKIFLHDITFEGQTIPCWSYVTDGFAAQHQKETVLTLRREIGQKPDDYPRGILELFAALFPNIGPGQSVEAGDLALFGEAEFLADKDVRGIGYVEPQGLLGVETSDAPLLAAILLKGDEAQIAWNFGLTRVTALIGMKYRYYPCPIWSDLERESLISLREMNNSLLRQISRVGVRASYYEEENHIYLSVPPSEQPELQESLDRLPPTKPVALRTRPDPRANACLVWRPGQNQMMAITRPNSNGSRMTGAFLAFLPEQNVNEVRNSEDGFVFFLTSSDWQKVREALRSGSDVFIPPRETAGASISIQWMKAKAYVSPVTGETYIAENWATYEPQCIPSASKQRDAVSAIKTVLLTEEPKIAARIAVEDLADYESRIEDMVDAFFTPEERSTNRQLTIHLALTPEGHKVSFLVMPALSAYQNADLSNRLEKVPAPKVGGPVELELILSVWGIPGGH